MTALIRALIEEPVLACVLELGPFLLDLLSLVCLLLTRERESREDADPAYVGACLP